MVRGIWVGTVPDFDRTRLGTSHEGGLHHQLSKGVLRHKLSMSLAGQSLCLLDGQSHSLRTNHIVSSFSVVAPLFTNVYNTLDSLAVLPIIAVCRAKCSCCAGLVSHGESMVEYMYFLPHVSLTANCGALQLRCSSLGRRCSG